MALRTLDIPVRRAVVLCISPLSLALLFFSVIGGLGIHPAVLRNALALSLVYSKMTCLPAREGRSSSPAEVILVTLTSKRQVLLPDCARALPTARQRLQPPAEQRGARPTLSHPHLTGRRLAQSHSGPTPFGGP